MAMHTDQVKSNHSLPTARRLQPATYLNSGYKSDMAKSTRITSELKEFLAPCNVNQRCRHAKKTNKCIFDRKSI